MSLVAQVRFQGHAHPALHARPANTSLVVLGVRAVSVLHALRAQAIHTGKIVRNRLLGFVVLVSRVLQVARLAQGVQGQILEFVSTANAQSAKQISSWAIAL
jgi:hypothetical protein